MNVLNIARTVIEIPNKGVEKGIHQRPVIVVCFGWIVVLHTRPPIQNLMIGLELVIGAGEIFNNVKSSRDETIVEQELKRGYRERIDMAAIVNDHIKVDPRKCAFKKLCIVL